MGCLAVSTFLTSVLLPATATLAEDIPAAGRSVARTWRRVSRR